MPFGLINAPTAFQRFINNIFFDLLDVYVVVYLDNILIYSNNMSEYHQHIKEVLKYLCKAGLYTKVEKCKFQDWLEPKKVKDIQFFLGFVNFYHQSIFNYLDIVIPLTHLIWKDIP